MRNQIVFKTGDVLEIPSIISTGPGWVLRPDEARTPQEIRTGKNKSFGRSSDGRKAANEWLADWLTNWFETRNWPEPASNNYDDNTYLHGLSLMSGGMNITIRNDAYGGDQFTLNLHEPTPYKTSYRVAYSWITSNLHKWLLTHEIDVDSTRSLYPFRFSPIFSADKDLEDRDAALEHAEKFTKDPIGRTLGFLREKHGNDVPNFQPPMLPPLEWPKKSDVLAQNDTGTVTLYVDSSHLFYKDKNYIKRAFTESYQAFNTLEQAFRHLGVKFRVRQTTQYGLPRDHPERGKYYVESVEIGIPSNKDDPHNAEGHTIHLTTTGVNIECGYLKYEERYEEYQRRQAANWLTQMEKEIATTPTYEDYDYTPGT